MNNRTTQPGGNRATPVTTPSQTLESPTKDYQDEDETRDSKLKAVWDNELGDLKSKHIPYQKAYVLLLSWHKDIDDLKTDEEVTKLDEVFRKEFMYKTTRKILTKDPRRSAQAQVNRYLADFVDDYDDANTLLIIYYAGHGRPGNVRGTLKLTGSTSPRNEYNSELHEIVWSSAEHNIKETRADVLVIFDCCHAGEIERNVRGHYPRRAFEFLAATSAKSTTRKPGPQSFTSALIYSLSHLVKQGSFSTYELVRTIQNDAPNFPDHQCPRLSERQQPASQRKIIFAPLTEEYVKKAIEASQTDDGDDFRDDLRQDLLLRFVFDQPITELVVKEIACRMQRLIHEREIKAKTVTWEGINMLTTLQYKHAMVAQPWLRQFSNILYRIRSNRGDAPLAEEVLTSEASKPVLDEAVQVSMSSGTSSADESLVTTPDPSRSDEPELGDDQGVSASKPLFLDTRSCLVSPSHNFSDDGTAAKASEIATPRVLKRQREIENGGHGPSVPAKRGRVGEED